MKGSFCFCAALFLFLGIRLPQAASAPLLVSIASPTNTASLLNDQVFAITAQAQSPAGSVVKVDFYDGATLLGTTTPPTFSLNLSAPLPKVYDLRAVATDEGGLSSTSSPVRVTVLEKIWSYTSPNGTGSPTMAQDGSIIAGSYDSVIALSTNGAVKWTFQTNAVFASTPAIGLDGTIYVAMGDRALYALNTNGVSKWKFAAGGDMYSCAAIANDGTIYVGASDSKLYAIRPNGTQKWAYAAEFGSPTAPAIAGDGTVYFTCDTKLYALTPAGALKWAFTIPIGTGSISMPAAIGADGTIYFGTTGKQLRAISPTGTNRWTFTSTVAFNPASPIVGSDGVVYASAGNLMYAISTTGIKKWQFTAPGAINGPAALDSGGSLYFCATERQFICVNAQGTLNWALNTPSRLGGAPLLSPDGRLCFTVGDGLLMLATSLGPDAGPWPMFHQNAQRRGQALSTPAIVSFLPAARTNYVAGQSIPLAVDGSSPNGPLARAEFYSDSVLIGTVTAQPFAFAWTNAPVGIHQVSAKIIDVAGANVASDSVRVDVAAPGTLPQILAQPIGFETTNTAKVALTTDAFGSMPILFQWLKDGAAIPGATNATLVLDNASIADSATYSVTLSNGAGAVSSSPAIVSVLQPYRVKWSAEVLDARGSPAIAQGTRLLIPDHNGITARGPGGQFLWQHRTDSWVWSSPALDAHDNAYFGVNNGDLASITTDGDGIWSRTNAAYQGSVAIGADGSVYSAVGTNFFAFNSLGETNWILRLPYSSSFSPVIDTNKTIFLGTDETYIAARTNYSAFFLAVNPDGSEKWRREFIRGFANSAAVTADALIIVGCRDTNVYALNPSDGTTRWKLPVEGPVFGSAAIAEDNTIYITSDAPREGATTPAVLYAIAPDGHVKWKFRTRGRTANSPAIARDGTIYFGATDGFFYAINPNGTTKWKIPNYSEVAASPVIGFDGTIYYSTTGQFNAVEGSSPLANSPWPMFRHDVRHTGNVSTPIANDTFYYPFSSNTFDDMVTVITRDGENIYVGGYFTIAGGVPANRIAKWDGRQWLALGAGLDAEVLSIAVDGTNVYAGGAFTHAGNTNANYIARWDGVQWSSIGGGMDDRVYDLGVRDGLLYAAGGFAHAGGQPANAVATWNGSQWQAVGDELYNGVIFDLLFDGSDLYASAYRSLGTINEPISSVVKWNGVNWVSVGDIYGDCRKLATFKGSLYVCGTDLESHGSSLGHLARWQNGAWRSVAAIDFASIETLAAAGDSLYVGGSFQKIAGTNINRIARYDGTNWFSLGKGVSGSLPRYSCSVNAIEVHGSDIFAGGAFTSADGKRNIYNFAHWNGEEWSSLGPLLRFIDGEFRLTLSNALGSSYGIEASEDLVNWTRVATFADQTSATQFVDKNAGKTPTRFYRAVTP